MINEAMILDYTVKATLLVLVLSLPTILASTALGILVSLLQALTQIQEQTLGFAIKLIASVIVLLVSARWMGGELYNYTIHLLDTFPLLVR
jgi:type III secretion protein S